MADTLPTSLQLEIVTPDRALVHETVEEITTPGKGGCLGILPGHAPLLSELEIGELTYKKSGQTHSLTVGGGFVEVLPDRVIVLTPIAERQEEVDRQRAEEARQRAEDRLGRHDDPNVDFLRARASLSRAMTRIQIFDRK